MQMGGVPNYASTFGWSDVAFLKRFLSLADFTDLEDVRSLDQGPWALEGFVPTDQTMVRWRCVCLQFRVASGYWIDTHDFRVGDNSTRPRKTSVPRLYRDLANGRSGRGRCVLSN
jgi:hypothetical protein